MNSIKLFMMAGLLAIPIGTAAWLGIRRVSRRRDSPPFWQCSAIILAGALIGQLFGLALFGALSHVGATGEVALVEGVVGYGTIVFAPWSGAGAWSFSHAFVRAFPHPVFALIVACSLALLAVAAFLLLASVFKIEGMGWMPLYAVSPILGASIGCGASYFRNPARYGGR
jgi:hypothetical protein